MSLAKKGFERIRHELKFRICRVVAKTYLTPKMVRLDVQSGDFAGFTSPAFDDHVKLFFPEPGTVLKKPIAGPNGLEFPEGLRPEGRDYTPRAFDKATNVLTLDFVLHAGGVAGEWADNAKIGDNVGVGGPRGSFVLRGEFDWYVLIGDETALPAISRRLEEIGTSKRVFAFIEVYDELERQELLVGENVDLNWLYRGDATSEQTRLVNAVESLQLPNENGFIFIAGEAQMAKDVRRYFVDARGHNSEWIKAAGYWQKGQSDFDDGHEH